MYLKTLGVAFLALVASSVLAQDADYKVKFQVEGLSNDTVYLANYYGKKLYYNDTALVDAKGRFEFGGKPFDEQGKYAVVLPGSQFVDFLIAGEEVDISTTVIEPFKNLKVNKSEDNRIFFEYINYINSKRAERQPYDMVIQDSTLTEDQKAAAYDMVKTLNNEVLDYQNKITSEHGDKLVGKYLRMAMEIKLPQELPPGVDEQQYKYYWYRDHYWDNVDLNDNRMVRDQMFDRLLDKYLNNILPQIPDTICTEAGKLVEKVMGKPDLFKFVVHKMTHFGETSKIMCMDKVFVYMVDNYYKTGMAYWYEDEEKLNDLIEAADKKANAMCGEVVPNIILPDYTGKEWKSLYDIKKPYSVVVIWESSCGHCKKELPKLKTLYERWNEKLEIFAIGNDFENDEWVEFIEEKEINSWINVSDNPEINAADSAYKLIAMGITTIESLNFRKTFDISSTPKIFLMDENKEVIAKQLNTPQLEELLGKLEEEYAAKLPPIEYPDDKVKKGKQDPDEEG